MVNLTNFHGKDFEGKNKSVSVAKSREQEQFWKATFVRLEDMSLVVRSANPLARSWHNLDNKSHFLTEIMIKMSSFFFVS